MVDIDKIIIYDASGYDKNKKTNVKFFIGYKNDEKTRLLCINSSSHKGLGVLVASVKPNTCPL